MSEEKEIKLTGKQKKFADAYLGEALFNATKAAKIAGYSGTDITLASVGYENLRKPQISAYIEEKLETHGMGANEVIARLAEIARGKVDDILDENGNFDINFARSRGKTHLIKKLKQKRTIKQKKTEVSDSMQSFLADDEIEAIETDVEIIYEETEFELYSAHEALRDLGKHHKLFTDKTEIEANINLKSLEEFDKEADERLTAVEEAVKKRSE